MLMREIKIDDISDVAIQDAADAPENFHGYGVVLPKLGHRIRRQSCTRLQVNFLHIPVDEHLPEFFIADIHVDHRCG